MNEKLTRILSRAVYALTAVLFLWAVTAIFVKNHYGYKAGLLAAASAGALILTVSAWFVIKKKEAFFIKYRRIVTAAFLAFMGTAQIIMIFPLRYTPVFDVDALFGGAAEWANTGDFASYHEYFSMFHNNWGGLILLRTVFGAARLFGIKDYSLPASLINSALTLLAAYLAGSVCAKLTGERGRAMAYFVFLISLPFYFIAPAFYTDSLTMLFPILILRLYITAREQERPIKRCAVFAAMGLAAGVGYGIKATAVIMLIAVVIDAFLRPGFKRFLPLIPISAAMIFACSLAAEGIVLRHLDREEAKELEIPIVHWIMMGTKGNGTYDPDEYEFTKSFEDPAERKKADADRLFNRLKTYDAKAFIKLFTAKLDVDFGDGTYGLSDCLGCPHGEDNALHRFLLPGGEGHAAYKHICTGVLIAIYILLIVSCVIGAFGKGAAQNMSAPRLALLGLLLFLLIWEARWRYFSNYAPVFIVSAVMGLEEITGLIDARKRAEKGKRRKKR